jgi:hypothetical protein
MTDPEATPAEEKDRGLHRTGPLNPEGWDEQKAVTGRPNDEAPGNSTFASRANRKPVVEDTKQDPEENKAVSRRRRKS